LTLNISQTATDTAIVTIEGEYETALNVLCAQLRHDLFAIAKFLFIHYNSLHIRRIEKNCFMRSFLMRATHSILSCCVAACIVQTSTARPRLLVTLISNLRSSSLFTTSRSPTWFICTRPQHNLHSFTRSLCHAILQSVKITKTETVKKSVGTKIQL